MGSIAILTQQVADLKASINNSKKINDLIEQLLFDDSSFLHASVDGTSKKIALSQFLSRESLSSGSVLSLEDGVISIASNAIISAMLAPEFTAVQDVDYTSAITLDFGAYQSFLISPLTGNVDFTINRVRPGFSKLIRLIGDGNVRAITFNIGKHELGSRVYNGESGEHYWYKVDCISETELAITLSKES